MNKTKGQESAGFRRGRERERDGEMQQRFDLAKAQMKRTCAGICTVMSDAGVLLYFERKGGMKRDRERDTSASCCRYDSFRGVHGVSNKVEEQAGPVGCACWGVSLDYVQR